MTGPDSRSPRRQEATREQARVLLDPDQFGLLQLLMSGEVSASGAARTLALPLSQVHYRLARLCAAGVAEVAREERRAGRAVKHYRSAAPEWYVPYEHTEAETATDLIGGQIEPRMREVYADIARLVLDRVDRHGVVLRVRGGQLNVQLAPDEVLADPPPGVIGFLGALRLPPQRARELQERLRAVISEFNALDEEGQPEHRFGVFLVPARVQD